LLLAGLIGIPKAPGHPYKQPRPIPLAAETGLYRYATTMPPCWFTTLAARLRLLLPHAGASGEAAAMTNKSSHARWSVPRYSTIMLMAMLLQTAQLRVIQYIKTY
jgi:hypothetical protein